MKWTEEQWQAITARGGHLCVDAGAGSGKTSVLVERIIQLLESGQAALDEIVAITFTEKAAGEMKDRLRRECSRRAARDDSQRFSFWRGIERQSDSARISTIHAFCANLVREHALALGLDPDFAVLTAPEERLLRLGVVQHTIEDLLEVAEPAALRAAAELGPAGLMRAAQALLPRRGAIAEWVAQRTEWDAGTVHAWWRARLAEHEAYTLDALRRDPALPAVIETLRGLAGECDDPSDLCERLRSDLLRGLVAFLEAPDTAAQRAAIAEMQALSARGGSKRAWRSEDAMAAVKDQLRVVRDLFGDFGKEKVDEAAEVLAASVTADVLSVHGCVAEAFEKAKRQRLVRDFDDLILDAERVLREHEGLRQQTARGIKYLLVDEFQDTDHRQLAMALMLAQVPGGPEVFFVGDAKQSIYHFRGAEVEVFAEAQEWAGETIRLAENFRSVPEILAFVDEFFRKTRLLAAVEADHQAMCAVRPPADDAAVEFLIPDDTDGLLKEAVQRLEARMIAARLLDLCAGPGETGHGFGDAAILLRAMSDVHVYEQALRDAGIPYVVASGRGFYGRQEVMDVRNLLATVIDPWDEIALLGFLRGPIAGLSDEDVLRLSQAGPLPAVMRDGVVPEDLSAPGRLAEARAMLAHLRERTTLDAGAFLRHVLECTGYEAILLGQYLGLQKTANVRKLADLAEELSGGGAPGVAEFVRYLDDVASEEPAEGDAGAAFSRDTVTIMSVHGAKGLEYPVVFLADTARKANGSRSGPVAFHRDIGLAVRVTSDAGEPYAPQISSVIRKREAEKEAEEHARILYVAMTRARDRLVISGGGDGAASNWMRSFDEAFGVLSAGDGDRIAGEGWAAVVRRNVPDVSKVKPVRVAEAVWPGPDALRARVEPVAITPRRRVSFPVTAVARAMADGGVRGGTAGERRAAEGASITGMERGTLVHEFLEQWDVATPAHEAADRFCRERLLPDGMATELQRVAEACAAHPLGQRIAADPQPRRERAFSLVVGDAVVEGKIDLLLSDGTLIDYKTGRAHPDGDAVYHAQLQLYAIALRTLDGEPPGAACLFYVDEGCVVPVEVSSECLDRVAARAAEAIAALRQTDERVVRDEPFMIGVQPW